jgi:hypothetical protein
MQPMHVSRRQILTLAGLTLGAGVVDLAGVTGPAHAAPGGGEPTLQPVADSPVAVLSGDGAAPAAAPRQLAVRVLRTGTLPAGARIAITFDPRRYAPVTPAVITLDGRPVAADKAVVTDTGTGEHTSTITLTEAVAATGDLVAVVGTAHPLLYPYDLVRHPAAPTARIRRSAQTAESQRPLRPARPSSFGGPARPWGIEVDALWGGESWGENDVYHYPVPVRITLRSVGPGPAPGAISFAVSADPRLVSAVEVASAQLNYRPYGKRIRRTGMTRTASVLRTQWRAPLRLVPGDVLDVYLDVATVLPGGQLTGLTHPVVALVASGAAASQRLTGRESRTRADAVCADAADG